MSAKRKPKALVVYRQKNPMSPALAQTLQHLANLSGVSETTANAMARNGWERTMGFKNPDASINSDSLHGLIAPDGSFRDLGHIYKAEADAFAKKTAPLLAAVQNREVVNAATDVQFHSSFSRCPLAAVTRISMDMAKEEDVHEFLGWCAGAEYEFDIADHAMSNSTRPGLDDKIARNSEARRLINMVFFGVAAAYGLDVGFTDYLTF